MKIRFATLDDIPACIEGGRRMHAMTRFAAYDYRPERMAQNLRAVIETGQNAHKTHCFFVAEDEAGQIIGALIGCVERHFFSDLLVASVIHYDVLPDRRMSGAGLKLLTAFRKWAENRGVFELSVGINSGVELEKMDRFLKKLGFRQTGGELCVDSRSSCRLGSTDLKRTATRIFGNEGIVMKQRLKLTRVISILHGTTLSLLLCVHPVTAQEQAERLSRVTNQSSQRYEINQTFGGQAFFKDNNIWAVNKEFADLFGMPQEFIDDLQGVAAAAFRIEDTSYQECGFGGKADACRKVEECVLDLYFDETKTPLPWATDIKMQWYPKNSSMRWLRPLDVRKERPHGTMAVEPPPGIIRNKGLNSAFIPFADPASKVEASFTTNAFDATGDSEAVSRGMYLLGYMRDFYRGLSVVSLQFSCETFSRKTINVRLDSKRNGIYEPPVARFNRVVLPERFVQRIKDLQKAQSDRNAVFYRSLFAPPLGTRGSQSNDSANR